MKTSKTYQALVSSLANNRLDSNAQLNYAFKILNGDNKEQKNEISDLLNADYVNLCSDQVQKGLDWLLDQWKTPNKKERKNNPFGYREQEILENFDTIQLRSYYDAGNAYRSYFVPLYCVVSKSGNTFEYYVSGGEIHIVG